MKYFLALISIQCLGLGMAKASDFAINQVDLSNPPYWMMSHSEYIDLLAPQKVQYKTKLLAELKKLRGLEDISVQKLDDAAEWHKDWDRIAKRVSLACKDPSLKKECDKIADIRIQTFEAGSFRKAKKDIEKP